LRFNPNALAFWEENKKYSKKEKNKAVFAHFIHLSTKNG
jgi:hypothetical protein